MTREWSEEGLNFEAEIKSSDLKFFGVQKVVVNKEDDEEDEDE